MLYIHSFSNKFIQFSNNIDVKIAIRLCLRIKINVDIEVARYTKDKMDYALQQYISKCK